MLKRIVKKIIIINNYSSSPNGLWVNSPSGRRLNFKWLRSDWCIQMPCTNQNGVFEIRFEFQFPVSADSIWTDPIARKVELRRHKCVHVRDILVINWGRWLAQSLTKALAEFRAFVVQSNGAIQRATVVLECAAFPFLIHRVNHHRQFDHKYRPTRLQIDTGDTENDKK